MSKLKLNGLRANQYKYAVFCALALLVFFAYFDRQLPQAPLNDNDYRTDLEVWIGYFISGCIISCLIAACYYVGRWHEYQYQEGRFKDVKD